MSPSASNSTSVASKSGDATAGFNFGGYAYNAAFQVGGSGSQSQDASAGLNGASAATNWALVAGIAAVALLGAVWINAHA